jgi:hypothetical protein
MMIVALIFGFSWLMWMSYIYSEQLQYGPLSDQNSDVNKGIIDAKQSGKRKVICPLWRKPILRQKEYPQVALADRWKKRKIHKKAENGFSQINTEMKS